ncbi:MAG: alanyl-tRNA editing protein AlaXM [Candidatus Aenigmatarchaeota archaeon]
MTNALYLKDSYQKEFEAAVVSAEGNKVILDATAFYPASGGQPNDTGTIARISDSKEFKVVNVTKSQGDIIHELDAEGLKTGDRAIGKIDWERRYALMKMHTSAHLLSEIFNRETGALITGNQLGIDKSRIDFSLENMDRQKISECFEKANEAAKQNLPVATKFMKREDAMRVPNITKLANVLPPSIDVLRIVEIGNGDKKFDVQADGGTHVANTSEIGRIELLDIENKGKNNRRVYYKVV